MIQEIKLYCNGPAWGEFKYCMEGPGEGYVPAVSAGKEKNNFFQKYLYPKKVWLFRFWYGEGGGGGVESASLCSFII